MNDAENIPQFIDMDAPDNILGRRLASLRKARKVRQIDVARYLNISRQAISKYELGTREPDVATLRKLAEYYGASTDYLLGVKDKDEDKSDKLDQTTVHRFLSSLEVAENIMARNAKSDAGASTEVTDAETIDVRTNIESIDAGSNALEINAGFNIEATDAKKSVSDF